MSYNSGFFVIVPPLFRPSEETTWGENANQKHTPGEDIRATACVKAETSSEDKTTAPDPEWQSRCPSTRKASPGAGPHPAGLGPPTPLLPTWVRCTRSGSSIQKAEGLSTGQSHGSGHCARSEEVFLPKVSESTLGTMFLRSAFSFGGMGSLGCRKLRESGPKG